MDDIRSSLGGESADFVVKARKAMPFWTGLPLLFLGVSFLAMGGVFSYALSSAFMLWNRAHATAPVIASFPLILPGILVAFLILMGALSLAWAAYRMLAPGPWFAGTPTRLVIKSRRGFRSIDWNQFSGDMIVKGSGDNGSIALRLLSTRFVSSGRYGRGRSVASVIYVTGISDAPGISDMIRKRISQHASGTASAD